MNETNQLPEWFDGKKVEEAAFCRAFLAEHPMICVSKSFFTKEGRICDESRLRREIYDAVNPYVTTGLAKKVDSLLELLRVEAYAEDLPVQTDRIHMANGTLFLDGTFTEEKDSQSGIVAKFYALCRGFGEDVIEGQARDILEKEAEERQRKKLLSKKHDRGAR